MLYANIICAIALVLKVNPSQGTLHWTAKLSVVYCDPLPDQEQRDSTVIQAAHISQSKSSLKWVHPGRDHKCIAPLSLSLVLYCLPLHWLKAGNQIGGTNRGGDPTFLLLALKQSHLGFNGVTIKKKKIRATSGESCKQTGGHCIIAVNLFPQ